MTDVQTEHMCENLDLLFVSIVLVAKLLIDEGGLNVSTNCMAKTSSVGNAMPVTMRKRTILTHTS